MKKKLLPLFAVTAALLWGFTSCSNYKDVVYINELTQTNVSKNRLEHIANLWVGHFYNKESAPTTGAQEIIGRRIWKQDRVDEHWVYLGWFQTDAYETALSSSLAQITKIAPDTAFITFYQIKEGIAIDPYEWKKDEPFKDLKRTDLRSGGEGCGSFIVAKDDGSYKVSANKPCYSAISTNINYYEIDAVLRPTQILFNTRFLDDQFNLVMSYKDNTFTRFTRTELEDKYEKFTMAY